MEQMGLAEEGALYSRIHGHSGEFGIDVFAGCFGCVAGEHLRRVKLVFPTEIQRGTGCSSDGLRAGLTWQQ